jgi:CheY-like chemotaxis protein
LQKASRGIKGHPERYKAPRIIMVTAYGREEVMQQVEKIGLDGFLVKPVSPSTLFDAIMEAFGKDVPRKARITREDEEEMKELKQIRGARILLVEDNEINQQVAQEILEGEGFVVEIANNGQEGVDMVQASDYDIVLMDIHMPVMDGYVATQEIRKLTSEKRNVPILAMTASAMTQDIEKALESGMGDLVAKPIDTNELFSTMVKWIKPGERDAPEHVAEEIAEPKIDKPLTDMPGISVKAGLPRVAGNIKLYKSILTKFYCDYSAVTQEIKGALGKKDQELAQRLAHTVKGVSGNIGAEDLYVVAGELEAAIKDEKTDEMNGLIDNFSEALNVVLGSLKGIIEIEDKAEEEQLECKMAGPTLLLELMLKLEPHLKKRKPKPCKEVMEEVNGYSWPDEYAQEIVELDRLIVKYKFKDAHPILESIVVKLKSEIS